MGAQPDNSCIQCHTKESVERLRPAKDAHAAVLPEKDALALAEFTSGLKASAPAAVTTRPAGGTPTPVPAPVLSGEAPPTLAHAAVPPKAPTSAPASAPAPAGTPTATAPAGADDKLQKILAAAEHEKMVEARKQEVLAKLENQSGPRITVEKAAWDAYHSSVDPNDGRRKSQQAHNLPAYPASFMTGYAVVNPNSDHKGTAVTPRKLSDVLAYLQKDLPPEDPAQSKPEREKVILDHYTKRMQSFMTDPALYQRSTEGYKLPNPTANGMPNNNSRYLWVARHPISNPTEASAKSWAKLIRDVEVEPAIAKAVHDGGYLVDDRTKRGK